MGENDRQLRLYDNLPPLPPKETIWTGSNWREFLKTVLMVGNAALHSGWLLGREGRVGDDSVIFKGLATGSLTVLPWVYWQHKLELVYFFFYWRKGHKDRKVYLGGMRS